MEVLKELKTRESKAYPAYMWGMQSCLSWEDLEDYCESSKVTVELLGNVGYLILTKNEIVDWVGDKNVFKAFRVIKDYYGNKSFNVDLRKSTSWPIMELMEKRGRITIEDTSSWDWDGEEMIEATIKIKGENKMKKLNTSRLIRKISKTKRNSLEYNELIQEFKNKVSEINPIETIRVDPEFVTCSTGYSTAYAWKINQDDLLIIENTRQECADSFQESYWLEYEKNINVILEEN